MRWWTQGRASCKLFGPFAFLVVAFFFVLSAACQRTNPTTAKQTSVPIGSPIPTLCEANRTTNLWLNPSLCTLLGRGQRWCSQILRSSQSLCRALQLAQVVHKKRIDPYIIPSYLAYYLKSGLQRVVYIGNLEVVFTLCIIPNYHSFTYFSGGLQMLRTPRAPQHVAHWCYRIL